MTMANPLWEPFLEMLEKMKLKMEEGPHFRISESDVERHASVNGFRLVSKKRSILLPLYIPILSDVINRRLSSAPVFRKFALITRFVFQ